MQSVCWFCYTAISNQSTLEIHISTVRTFVLVWLGFFFCGVKRDTRGKEKDVNSYADTVDADKYRL